MDIGLRAIARLREMLMPDEPWLVEHPRGYDYWGNRLRQSITAEAPRSDASTGLEVSRIVVRTDLVRVADDVDHAMLALASAPLDTRTSLPWRGDGGLIGMHVSMDVHEEVFDWTLAVLAFAVVLQAVEAERQVEVVASRLAARPAFTDHPEAGVRAEPDALYPGFLAEEFPSALPAPDWAGSDAESCANMLSSRGMLAVVKDGMYFVMTPFSYSQGGDLPATISAWPRFRSETFGHGLEFDLDLPVDGSPELIARLNAIEVAGENAELTFGYGIGYWHGNPMSGRLRHSIFVPARIYRENLLMNLTMSAMGRAMWAQSLLDR